MVSRFFGLTPKDKPLLHKAIFQLVFFGGETGAGFSWDVVYNLPIWLRNFYSDEVEAWFRRKNEASTDRNFNKNNKDKNNKTSGVVNPPSFGTGGR